MEETRRLLYEAPVTSVLEVDIEGIVCQSGGLKDYDRENGQTW